MAFRASFVGKGANGEATQTPDRPAVRFGRAREIDQGGRRLSAS